MNTIQLSSKIIASYRPLEEALLATLAYADLFDYPLSAGEIHRYLHGIPAYRSQIEDFLESSVRINRLFDQDLGFYFLEGRREIVSVRRSRAEIARASLPRALRYGSVLGSLPFVRMVALTGSLAVSNSERSADFDYFIITSPGRLWLCRALVILVVRRVAFQFQETLCPNFLISENAIQLPQRNIYTAHEVTQMVPITGLNLYHQFRARNTWIEAFLPNATGFPPLTQPLADPQKHSSRRLERILNQPIVNRLEFWEMQRKIRRYQQQTGNPAEIQFSPDWCQGHFSGHAQRTLQLYDLKLECLSERLLET